MDSTGRLRPGGAITALVTPFHNGEVDGAALEALVEWQVLSGVDGLALCTAAGEGLSLSPQERRMVLDICVRTAADRIPVIAAAGTNCTESTIALIRDAEECGARAALVTVPYYSKPGQKGILHHFQQIAAASNLPVLIENAPARTASDLTVETLERLAELDAIVAIVDATGDIARFANMPPALRHRFRFLSGHDGTALSFHLAGGDGIISAAANILPRLVTSLQQAAYGSYISAALALSDRLHLLLTALGSESDPARLKYALQVLRGTEADLRLPLVPAETESRSAIVAALSPFVGGGTHRIALSL
ncbi:4-hydroxy-tetrahydrodipicolinate synthase [Rhizobium sp. BK196]|jgi:4-hydroxy-tetrahydrodipicolinate synthase|uniref:4-hydroxy-tetrahydrodipicolinate synthase n=1 Tax=Rhizobium sp. BK196 TaxID=2587073 RepID=UPI001608471D|nr:4-hydroxy-tetrahydrodipicolinate synthase [Rhizobium sp. BK196]MBB3310662.1 4-hydroxy-tetrahydrodipicolinate synthase [Rhizobium sp. BK196]